VPSLLDKNYFGIFAHYVTASEQVVKNTINSTMFMKTEEHVQYMNGA